ncbi:hypothetical protein [Roseobacter litoralis]|uniref:hypothetical protein n=1 Tax=Roseobacter litoralis TaxID=42443 RepID=UPI00249163FC|nr:hypothetical protein [Roseobacter litoralis]
MQSGRCFSYGSGQGGTKLFTPTPVAQKLICLAGAVRVTASDGMCQDIGPGDVWHMQDTHGKGHHTVVTSDCDFEAVIIQYD